MPRAKYKPNSEFPMHITGRCINKDWFSMPMNDVWEIMSNQLYFLSHAFEFKIISFVLMSNHFHLLVQTPKANLAEGMAYFMRETSRSITKDSKRINQTYGANYGRCVIENNHHLMNVYKYIYHNPVKAGLVEKVENYPYSTLLGKIGKKHLLIPVVEDNFLLKHPENTLRWLNRKVNHDQWEDVRKAAKRSKFKLTKINNNKNLLESQFL